ncbi:rCG53784 [Rattus norvegicus]|uniref:RCG53784 n=1 Tax=Rattus norvegicus TaxID=10116 RepID=A6J8E5_RAT|nr:rCG53784 [Rattus norvegicus]
MSSRSCTNTRPFGH